MFVTTSQTLLRTADLDDVDRVTDLHTLARTAYYTAGGLSDGEFTSPDARSSRREDWIRALQDDTRSVLCAVREGEMLGIVSMGAPCLRADPDV